MSAPSALASDSVLIRTMRLAKGLKCGAVVDVRFAGSPHIARLGITGRVALKGAMLFTERGKHACPFLL